MLSRTAWPGCRLHDSDLARDVVHDVFLSLLDSDTAPDGCAAYLARGVRNRCLNIIRDTDTRRRLGMGYLLEMERYDLEDWPDEETLAKLRKLMQTGLTDKCMRGRTPLHLGPQLCRDSLGAGYKRGGCLQASPSCHRNNPQKTQKRWTSMTRSLT